ncbi:MAG: heme exporter protein CcmD [Candidatus Paracaedimonas acanthamoebae]|uniref:Heme exporter protein CcmD n=1 Tax=Candidatus Paracaedimonas acanthamoebae TaxID=244581 RepID=A0A8J7PL35_9PROT|nr:heme exporter protein CcmD [Candidatus Paracaedimonas acanthamoebae]
MDTSYLYYIASAYAITLISCLVFFVFTYLKVQAAHKRIKRLEQTLKHHDI